MTLLKTMSNPQQVQVIKQPLLRPETRDEEPVSEPRLLRPLHICLLSGDTLYEGPSDFGTGVFSEGTNKKRRPRGKSTLSPKIKESIVNYIRQEHRIYGDRISGDDRIYGGNNLEESRYGSSDMKKGIKVSVIKKICKTLLDFGINHHDCDDHDCDDHTALECDDHTADKRVDNFPLSLIHLKYLDELDEDQSSDGEENQTLGDIRGFLDNEVLIPIETVDNGEENQTLLTKPIYLQVLIGREQDKIKRKLLAAKVVANELGLGNHLVRVRSVSGNNLVRTGSISGNNLTRTGSNSGNNLARTGSNSGNNLTRTGSISGNTLTRTGSISRNHSGNGGGLTQTKSASPNSIWFSMFDSMNRSTLDVSNAAMFESAFDNQDFDFRPRKAAEREDWEVGFFLFDEYERDGDEESSSTSMSSTNSDKVRLTTDQKSLYFAVESVLKEFSIVLKEQNFFSSAGQQYLDMVHAFILSRHFENFHASDFHPSSSKGLLQAGNKISSKKIRHDNNSTTNVRTTTTSRNTTTSRFGPFYSVLSDCTRVTHPRFMNLKDFVKDLTERLVECDDVECDNSSNSTTTYNSTTHERLVECDDVECSDDVVECSDHQCSDDHHSTTSTTSSTTFSSSLEEILEGALYINQSIRKSSYHQFRGSTNLCSYLSSLPIWNDNYAMIEMDNAIIDYNNDSVNPDERFRYVPNQQKLVISKALISSFRLALSRIQTRVSLSAIVRIRTFRLYMGENITRTRSRKKGQEKEVVEIIGSDESTTRRSKLISPEFEALIMESQGDCYGAANDQSSSKAMFRYLGPADICCLLEKDLGLETKRVKQVLFGYYSNYETERLQEGPSKNNILERAVSLKSNASDKKSDKKQEQMSFIQNLRTQLLSRLSTLGRKDEESPLSKKTPVKSLQESSQKLPENLPLPLLCNALLSNIRILTEIDIDSAGIMPNDGTSDDLTVTSRDFRWGVEKNSSQQHSSASSGKEAEEDSDDSTSERTSVSSHDSSNQNQTSSSKNGAPLLLNGLLLGGGLMGPNCWGTVPEVMSYNKSTTTKYDYSEIKKFLRKVHSENQEFSMASLAQLSEILNAIYGNRQFRFIVANFSYINSDENRIIAIIIAYTLLAWIIKWNSGESRRMGEENPGVLLRGMQNSSSSSTISTTSTLGFEYDTDYAEAYIEYYGSNNGSNNKNNNKELSISDHNKGLSDAFEEEKIQEKIQLPVIPVVLSLRSKVFRTTFRRFVTDPLMIGNPELRLCTRRELVTMCRQLSSPLETITLELFDSVF